MNRQITRTTNLISLIFGLLVCFMNLNLANAQNKVDSTYSKYRLNTGVYSGTKPSAREAFNDIFTPLVSEAYYNLFPPSVREMYNNAVAYINKGEIETAKKELNRALYEIDYGKCKECSDEHTTRLIEYKSHVILANIAFAEKSMWDLDRELSFFKNADTTYNEWKRARYAATHFKHKYYQLMNGRYGKVLGDWVSVVKEDGIPLIWIRFYMLGNTMYAELKDCAMKNMLDSKYSHSTDKIVVDNSQNIVEVNFGESKLMPGMQFLPSALVSMVNEMGKTLSEMVAWKSVNQFGTPYSSYSFGAQMGINFAVGIIGFLISRAAVTKETMTSESFVMRQIASEVYMADIKLRNLTAYSDGRSKDEFNWAEIPVFHLYPSEEMDFSKGNFEKSIANAFQYMREELKWDDSRESIKISNSVEKEILSSFAGICSVEDTKFDHPFYFLGKDINVEVNSEPHATSFTGLARVDNIWGARENPISPLTNKSIINKHIVPMRGEFKTVLGPYECVTFTGDWHDFDEGGNGLLTYVNTYSPEFSFTYEGTIQKGYPHGLGIWQGDDFRYVGWFYKGKKFGYGTMTYPDGKEVQGFVTEDGSMIPESMVTWEMKQNFNKKVEDIASDKYESITEDYYWLNE